MKTRLTWLIRLIALNLLVIGASIALADNANQELPLPLTPTLREGFELVEGDLVLPVEARGRATYDATLWTGGIIPYSFSGTISGAEQAQMRAAMDSWESEAGVTFVPRTSQFNYLYIVEEGGNWSYIGMIGGMQELSMYNWSYHYIIMHELAHALGFWHEQSRPDRDQYVTINWANIYPGLESNFQIRSSASTVGSYDFESIMHYGDYDFSYNGNRTIVAKPAYAGFQNIMGNPSRLSAKDAAGMRRLYPKPAINGDVPGKAFALPKQESYITTQNTSAFGKGANEPTPNCAISTGKTVWYKITPTNDRILSIYAGGFDTVLAVYTGKPGEWKQHACADNVFDGGSSEYVMVNARAGQSYYVVVGGHNGASGDLLLEVYSTRNLIRNGDFHWGKTGWVVNSSPSTRADDKVACGVNARATYGSKCAFQFTGGVNENSTIVQNIPATRLSGIPFSVGQTYTLWMSAASTDAGNLFGATVVVTYQDGSKQTLIDTGALTATPSHTWFSGTGSLSRADVKKFSVTLTHSSASVSTKLWLDSLQLRGPAETPLRMDEMPPSVSRTR